MDTSKIKNSYLKEFIKLKAVVHCPTKELAKKVTGYAEANGLKWCIGYKYSDLFIYEHSEDTCYYLSKGEHCCISYYKEKGYLIIPAHEFIDKYEAAEKLDNWKPKVGDVLIAVDECVVSLGKKSLIIGKEYPVSRLYNYGINDGIIISSEFNEYPRFTYDNLHKYFKPKPAQDIQEIKPAIDAERIAALERMVADLIDQNARYRKEIDKAVEFFNQIIS